MKQKLSLDATNFFFSRERKIDARSSVSFNADQLPAYRRKYGWIIGSQPDERGGNSGVGLGESVHPVFESSDTGDEPIWFVRTR